MTSVNTKGAQKDDDLEDPDHSHLNHLHNINGGSPSLDGHDLLLNSESAGIEENGGDLDMPFEDKGALLEHLANLEEENLFKIHLVQEDEQALEAARKDIAHNQALKEKEIADVRRNIEMLEHSRAILYSKQQFLESNMKMKQQGHNGGGHGKTQSQPSTATPDATSSTAQQSTS